MNINKFFKAIPKPGMGIILILVFAGMISACTKRTGAEASVITVEDIPYFEENVIIAEKKTVEKPEAEASSESVVEIEEKREICIHICGAVNTPGVYMLDEGSRVYEAVMAAGGYADNADRDYVNQALVLKDSDKLVIPTLEDTARLSGEGGIEGPSSSYGIDGTGSDTEGTKSGVNINTAGIEELCTLNGIGEARAKAIIAYRTDNGPFKDISDIMNVSGIKQSSFDKIKDDIRVN